MAGKAPPYVTMMLCVAGCSSTTSGTLPHSRALPPPNFDVNGVATRSTQPVWDEQPIAQPATAAPKAPLPTPKPVTAEAPPNTPKIQLPKAPVLATQFKAVPDSYLSSGSTQVQKTAKRPFFTPLALPVPLEPAKKEMPHVDAQAILEPLTVELPLNSVVLPEPIPYPQYVAVGPEYFGASSDIAPYVLDPRNRSPEQDKNFARQDPVALRPQRSTAEANGVPERFSPLPRRRPSLPLPEDQTPNVQIAAIVPPRPEPSPRRAPPDPMPRLKPLREPEIRSPNEPVDAPQYRVRLNPEQTATDNIIASLNVEPPILTAPLPDLSIVVPEDQTNDQTAEQAIEQADAGIVTPLPRRKPPQRASVRFSGKTATDDANGSQSIATQPANDSAAQVNCLVNQGSNDRMILICEGIDVSQAHVFRAVVEGESAFRGLRPFDTPEKIVSSYGFNAERFHAMSQGPRSARDLAFLRALRKSGKTVRAKGRDFEMYLMKGDHQLATVLVEQFTGSEQLNAVGQ